MDKHQFVSLVRRPGFCKFCGGNREAHYSIGNKNPGIHIDWVRGDVEIQRSSLIDLVSFRNGTCESAIFFGTAIRSREDMGLVNEVSVAYSCNAAHGHASP